MASIRQYALCKIKVQNKSIKSINAEVNQIDILKALFYYNFS